MSHFKLGLLALAALLAISAIAIVIGVRTRPTDVYHTYFDETVEGLEVGAAVKFRGVRIGSVTGIGVAPDRRLIRVALAIDRGRARELELEQRAPTLRAELTLVGLTGVKTVDIDVGDPRAGPPPALGFAPGSRYIPARRSLIARVEHGLDALGERGPVLIDRTIATLDQVRGAVTDLRRYALPERIAGAVATVDSAARELRGAVRRIGRSELPERVAGVASKVERLVDQLGGEHGLVASARRATDALGDLGRASGASSGELEQTLHDVGEAARSIRDFVEQLDREPDMLLKGHARSGGP